MIYHGFIITTSPDSGVLRENEEGRFVPCEGYFCEVYAATDENYENRLDYFCIAKGYEYSNDNNEDLENAIRKYIGDMVFDPDNYSDLTDARIVDM